MVERSVSVKLKAEIAGYVANLRTASRATRDFGDKVMENATRNRAEFETVGTALLGVGTAAVAGLAMATKAAIDWESAWTGVTKTVDGTSTQMAALEGELREMARSLPATHDEIAAVAEAAGQLGIKREAITGFTRTMIDLGNTTNLSADEAASAIAQFANVMGTSQGDVDKFGSALVALGNTSATTEADILSMASRMAGAGKLIGASESDVLAMAAAMSSVGISAEAGGGSMSRVMQQIYTAVSDGEDALAGFAQVAGMSAEDFASKFRSNPVQAINEFVQGLNRVESSGGNVVGVLSELGIKSSEDLRTVLGLKGATDLLSSSLDTASSAWEENSALTAEAEKRYATAASQIQVAWNKIKDAAIDVGAAIVPIVAGIAGFIGDLATAFAELPGPAKSALGVLGGLGGVLAVIAGGALLALPRLAETRAAIDALVPVGGKARRSIVGIGKAAGGAVLGLAVLGEAMNAVFGKESTVVNMEALTIGLERWTRQSEVSGEAARFLGSDLGELNGALEQLGSWSNFAARPAQGLLELFSSYEGPITTAENKISELGRALAGLVESGKGDVAAEVFQKIAVEAEKFGISTGELIEMMPEYTAAQEVAADGAKDLGEGSAAAAEGMGEMAVSAEDAAEAIDDMLEALMAAVETVYNLRSAEVDFQAAIDAASESIANNGANLDINTEKGRENRTALDAVAMAALEQADAMVRNGASHKEVQGAMESARDEFIRIAGQMGVSKSEANKLADSLGLIPGNYTATVTANTGGAQNAVDTFIYRNSGRIINIGVRYQTSGSPVGSLPYSRFATGGPIHGPGSGTSDTAGLFALSNGEHVLTAEEVRAAGGHGAIEAWRRSLVSGRQMASGGGIGMASGGRVSGLGAVVSTEAFVKLGDVTDDEWRALLDAGWQGRAGDQMEALYPPMRKAADGFIRLGDATDAEFEALLAAGWRGVAGDKMEALYPPMDRLRVAIDKTASGLGKTIRPLTGKAAAAAEMLGAIAAGREFFEDFSFQGMKKGGNADRFQEQLMDEFYRRNPGVNFGTKASRTAVQRFLRGYHSGGPVLGSGTGDKIHALLEPGEHVWTRGETAAAGGHGAVQALRSGAVRGAPTAVMASQQVNIVINAPHYTGPVDDMFRAARKHIANKYGGNVQTALGGKK